MGSFVGEDRFTSHPRRPQRGFSLAEALIATAVLAIVSASAALPFAAGIQQTNEAAKLEEAVALGQAMMEEILARPFFQPGNRVASPGPGTGETSRPLFDNIDAFDSYAESDHVAKNYQNVAITDASAAGFWRQVSVQYITLPTLSQAATDVNSLVHIQVQVYYNDALLVTLDRIAGR
ncbi:MAG TPA: prepilin-type N-terminal cleavage/methylation domain-containing protein, partial [Phycisphaerae bacterium]|nr:prepilin-type N-terminal cleavage/methylation domain-containing protein [Phycisphaerae bacterium]